jgi:hypothetical protein
MPRLRLVEQSAWTPVDYAHRCSRKFCDRPACLVHVGEARSWSAPGPSRSWPVRRFLCRWHAAECQLVEHRGRWMFELHGHWPLERLPRRRDHAHVVTD